MESPKMLLVSAQVLPSVFAKVVEAKRLLAVGKVRNLSEAAKASGISRSALYKYKDHVFIYNEHPRRRGGPGVHLRPAGKWLRRGGHHQPDQGVGRGGGGKAGQFPLNLYPLFKQRR